MPGTDTGLPVVGDLQSIPLNELRRSVPPTTSVREYMESQLQIVSDTLAVPVADQAIDDMKLEAFAVHFMEKDLIDAGPDDEENGYPLCHSDLRLANIIVNDELQINGIIDWDDASTVPKQLFSPPPWISGVDDESIMEFQLLHAEFRGILVAKSKTNSICGEMLKQWYGATNGEPNKALYVAHIIRYPTELAEVVARLHKRLGLIGKLRTDIHAYYKSSIAVQEEVQKRAALCDEYTSYLKNRGLYKDRPLDLKALKANLERVEEMLRSHGL
ncbi:phosphotransferase enzyme family protein [Metarhizium brunneum]